MQGSLGSSDHETTEYKIPQEMNKALNKIPVENVRRDFFLLSNVDCIFSLKMVLDDKKAQGS